MDNEQLGMEPDAKCNRDGCEGIIKLGDDDINSPCTCFNNPPCLHCTTIHCPICGFKYSS